MTYFFWNKKLFLILLPLTLLGQVAKKDLSKLAYKELSGLFEKNRNNRNVQLACANAYWAKANIDNDPIRKAKGCYLFSFLYKGDKEIYFLDRAIKYSGNDLDFLAYTYSEKAYLLKKQFRFREAIDNFIIAEKYAHKSNLDFYYDVKFSIAVLRSEELGEVREALDMYRECHNYYKDKPVRTPQYSIPYQNVLFALADAHKALYQTDSATYYNRLGYRESKSTKATGFAALFVLNEGANLVLKKNFGTALDSINKALPSMIAYKDKDEGNTLAAYYYLGKAYEGLGKKVTAAKNFIKVDSLYKKTKSITPEFVSGYPFLISYYKGKGDKEKQLKYIITYMTIDSTLQKNYKELTKKLQKEYDTPHLFSEKVMLINSLKKEEKRFYWGIGVLLVLLIGISIFGLYQYRLKKRDRLRFEAIMNLGAEAIEDPITTILEVAERKTNKSKKEDIGIAEELVNKILEKLKLFETKKDYLESTITIQILAERLETNSKYVSKIVNAYKDKTFVQYINDLRIEHAIANLKQDKRLRKYTMQALALEFGFNSAESFSIAFYKKEGIKATYFIKELDKM
jgi:AraC-like DNA-binding protein